MSEKGPIRKLTFEEITALRPTAEALRSKPRLPLVLMLDNIRSLYNVGSVFRTADGARVEKIVISGITGYPPRKEIDKTALGATETVPWERIPDPVTAIRQYKERGYQIVALEHTDASVPYWDFPFTFPSLLILGNEVWGVSDEILPMVDAAVEIPMLGAKQSLNVSVACGVVVYHILNHYLKHSGEPGVQLLK